MEDSSHKEAGQLAACPAAQYSTTAVRPTSRSRVEQESRVGQRYSMHVSVSLQLGELCPLGKCVHKPVVQRGCELHRCRVMPHLRCQCGLEGCKLQIMPGLGYAIGGRHGHLLSERSPTIGTYGIKTCARQSPSRPVGC